MVTAAQELSGIGGDSIGGDGGIGGDVFGGTGADGASACETTDSCSTQQRSVVNKQNNKSRKEKTKRTPFSFFYFFIFTRLMLYSSYITFTVISFES